MEFKTKNLRIVSPAADQLWSEPWELRNRFDDNDLKGRLCFYGDIKYGEIELDHDLPKETIENGWAKEGLLRFLNWAFTNKQLIFIHTTAENKYEEHFFESMGWMEDGKNENGRQYMFFRPLRSWKWIYAAVGFAMGLAWGYMFNKVWLFVCIGAFAGFTVGQFFEISDGKKFKKTLEARRRYLDSLK